MGSNKTVTTDTITGETSAIVTDAASQYLTALPTGTIIDGGYGKEEYEITGVLGQGGFGITYKAKERNGEKREVAIKEYYPSQFATRIRNSADVSSTSASNADWFNKGKVKFIEEAKILSNFNEEPNIVHVLRCFEENNTAYFAMQYLNGETLKSKVERENKLSETETNKILFPVMEALEKVHNEGLIHRDIAPDNIIVTPEGIPYIIDFGAARHETDDHHNHSMTVVMKYGFAPFEQTTRTGEQKAFTDVYAMAATYYYAVTGKVPQDSVGRMLNDTLISPRLEGAKIGEETEKAIMKALALKPEDRYQSMEEFKSALDVRRIDPIFTKAVEIMKKADRLKGKEACEKYKEAIVLFENSDSIEEAKKKIKYCQARIKDEEAIEQADKLNSQDKYEKIKAANIGEKVYFGTYKKSSFLEKEAIEWRILEKKEKEILLISDKAIDCKKYNYNKEFDATWEKCSLRKWLNDTFFKEAFSSEEQERIQNTFVSADKNPEYDADPGNATVDKVFLLSIDEITRYFNADEARMCALTAYAETKNADTSDIFKTENGENTCYWWLRSPDSDRGFVVCVDFDGSFLGTPVDNDDVSVRPALWINLGNKEEKKAADQAADEKVAAEKKAAKEAAEKAAKEAAEKAAREAAEKAAREAAEKAAREAAEKAAKEAEIAKIKRKVIRILTITILCIAACFSADKVIVPNIKYNTAVKMMNNGSVVEAYDSFIALNGYKDSTEKADDLFIQYKNEKLRAAEIGDVVSLGTYEQDNILSNGKEDIEWLVLDKKDNKILIISDKALDCQQYNSVSANVTWENCSLREWLNNVFFNTAFTSDEQGKIESTNISADKNPKYNIDPGNDTSDKVFLLSITEANKYFVNDEARKCVPTAYAKASGAYVKSDCTKEGAASCLWWLRTPGSYQDYTASVYRNGSAGYEGRSVSYDRVCVRPALWINPDS